MRKGRGEIMKLSDLFDKYKKILKAPQGVVVDCFIEVVDDLIGIKISKEQISYTVHTRTLSVRVSGPLKSEIKLRKKELLVHIKGRLGDGAPLEII